MSGAGGTLSALVLTGLGLRLHDATVDGPGFAELAGLALRDNPKRAHLVVSRVLAKHIPAHPEAVLGAGHALGDAVLATLAGAGHAPTATAPLPPGSLVLGFCETATGLGHAVAERLDAPYLHSTRREHPDVPVAARFEEEHSHATAHLIQPSDPVTLDGEGPLVLVDDELTTGRTALNTIAALHADHPRALYVLAVLLDARTEEARAAFEAAAAASGVTVLVAGVLTARLELPADVLDRAAGVRAALPPPAPVPAGEPGQVVVHRGLWPQAVPVTARHGMAPADTARMAGAARRVAEVLVAHPTFTHLTHDDGDRGSSRRPGVLVLGTEEVIHAPVRLAAALAADHPGWDVGVQSTTRSPVHAADTPGYAVRRAVTFPAPDDPLRRSRVHNLADPAADPPGAQAWSDRRAEYVVVLVDAPEADCLPMGEALAPFASVAVHLVLTDPPPPATT